jgi:hypothetical protein
MASFLVKKEKTPHELVLSALNSINNMILEKEKENLCKRLEQMKYILYSDSMNNIDEGKIEILAKSVVQVLNTLLFIV